jgi:hypothetical protein
MPQSVRRSVAVVQPAVDPLVGQPPDSAVQLNAPPPAASPASAVGGLCTWVVSLPTSSPRCRCVADLPVGRRSYSPTCYCIARLQGAKLAHSLPYLCAMLRWPVDPPSLPARGQLRQIVAVEAWSVWWRWKWSRGAEAR